MSTNLIAIVRATRASANAVKRMQIAARALQDARDHASQVTALKAHDRARNAYQRAQETLRANPLPGDSEHV